MRSAFATGLILSVLLVVGCRPSGGVRHELRSDNPLDRAQAVVRAADRDDATAVPKLVDLLDDQDGAVRMYAILALRRMCGEDFGYRFYDAPRVRALAVERWRAALRAGEIELQKNPPTSQSTR